MLRQFGPDLHNLSQISVFLQDFVQAGVQDRICVFANFFIRKTLLIIGCRFEPYSGSIKERPSFTGGLFFILCLRRARTSKGCGKRIFPRSRGDSEAKRNAIGAVPLWGAMLSASEVERLVLGQSPDPTQGLA